MYGLGNAIIYLQLPRVREQVRGMMSCLCGAHGREPPDESGSLALTQRSVPASDEVESGARNMASSGQSSLPSAFGDSDHPHDSSQ